MGRDKRTKGQDSNRMSGGFVALPWTVLDSPAYADLSYPARALLIEIARQCVHDNNGRLLASRAYLLKRGWKSQDVITRALRELLAAKLIHQTVQGHRPNKASWFAVTWRSLDRIHGFDAGAAETFARGAFLSMALKNTNLRPAHGVGGSKLRPSGGSEGNPPVPSHGVIPGRFGSASAPPNGHHLEMPSVLLSGRMSSA